MTNTRKTLNAAAEELRERHGYTGSVSDVFQSEVTRLYGEFKTFAETGPTQEELTAALSPVREAIALFNDEQRMLRLEQLEAMKTEDAIKEYLRTQNVSGLKVSGNAENGFTVISKDKNGNNVKVSVDAWDVLEALYPVEKGAILDAICIFMDNVAKVHFANTEKSAVNRSGLSESYIAMRNRKGWEIKDIAKTGRGTLLKQLNELVSMAFRGAGVTMIKADLKFIEDSLFDTKNGADTAGSYVMRNEKTVVGYIFRALYTRYNKLPYGFQNSSNAENTPESESVNKAMAEAEQKHGDETTVTAESVEIPVGTPKGGKGSKKDKTAA